MATHLVLLLSLSEAESDEESIRILSLCLRVLALSKIRCHVVISASGHQSARPEHRSYSRNGVARLEMKTSLSLSLSLSIEKTVLQMQAARLSPSLTKSARSTVL
ncbi:hypothetical protein KP509_1Z005000 [Ceratopteris richardii]|nr:hypothetical protein KP509_1Z005000 [Ceratopteris richardii]